MDIREIFKVQISSLTEDQDLLIYLLEEPPINRTAQKQLKLKTVRISDLEEFEKNYEFVMQASIMTPIFKGKELSK